MKQKWKHSLSTAYVWQAGTTQWQNPGIFGLQKKCRAAKATLRDIPINEEQIFRQNGLAAAVDGFLEFRPGNELRDFLGRNFQRSSGLRIPAGSRFARADRKSAKTNQRHFASLLQRRFNAVERRIQSIACLDFGYFRILCDLVD